MAFLILNHVNDHHVFFHRNRSLWAVVTNLALLIFAEVLYYHMNRVFIQKSHKPDKTRLYLKMGATYRLPWYTLDLSQWRPQQCSQCSLCSVFSVLHGRLGPGARQPDLQVIMTTDQSTISQLTKTTRPNAYKHASLATEPGLQALCEHVLAAPGSEARSDLTHTSMQGWLRSQGCKLCVNMY